MNKPVFPLLSQNDRRRRAEVFKFLEEICEELDLTQTQSERAKTAYKAVSSWVAGSTHPLLSKIDLTPQGSTALGTTVKPIGKDEFDVDLICLLLQANANMSPENIKRLIGTRLAENETYRKMLIEKKRCWRLDYAGDFHLDISSTIKNPKCLNDGELVSDKKLKGWHPTNPKGYRKLFESRAALAPRMKQGITAMQKMDHASIEPFPDQSAPKGILRRVVQLLKRHRDWHFLNVKEEVAPISVLITTLAMCSYEHCIGWYTFEDELDVLIATIRMMPHFIETSQIGGRTFYAVWNETTDGENFADRWNTEPERVRAFYAWHKKALSDFEELKEAIGFDRVISLSSQQFGKNLTDRIVSSRNEQIDSARKAGLLYATPAIGLVTKPAIGAIPIPKNDFFGD